MKKVPATLLLLGGFCFAAPVPVIVSPATVWMRPTQTQQFTANTPVGKTDWTTDKGTISATGLYTASDAGVATITATPRHCTRCKGTVQVNVTGAPMSYPLARTDQNTEQLPNPMPVWGPAGSTWVHPAFPGTVYTRLTDANTNRANTLETADSGNPQLGSIDGTHVVVKNTGQIGFVVDDHGVKTGVGSGYSGLQFSSHQPLELFALKGTEVRQLVAKADWSGLASDTVLFDFASANCLGVGYKSTWHGNFGIAVDDATFTTAFSNTGAQGSGTSVAVWSAANGCFVYDSLAGTVYGPNGLVGSIDDGVNPLSARFYLHEASGTPSNKYLTLSATIHQPNGHSGCVVGPCLVDRPYVWEIGTTHLRPCDIQCAGHAAKGANGFYSSRRYTYHAYADPRQPLTPMINPPADFPDQHGSGHNQVTNEPVFLVSADVGDVIIPYPFWGYNEVIAVTADGSNVFYRIGQTLNTGNSVFFICQNSVGVVAQDGHHLFFTSDMGGNGALGYQADGVTPRCDVFSLTF